MRLLIEGCKKYDRESQRLLYKHYYGYAMSICLRYSGSKEEASEILNDGFLKVFTKINHYNIKKSFKGWLSRIMINTAIDRYRQNKRFKKEVNAPYQEVICTVNALDELSYHDVMHLVQKLSPQYRAVFNLYVIDGFTHNDIAKKLNISVGTSKSNLCKARENLRKMLKVASKTLYEQYI
ncbi:MAG: sigma-70 family RNA polymerase sigma factor [Fulvivirga sp.]|nr:sigma-70 family RNA polymerase sigma factor [Fulvivirga sp.]